VVTDGRRRWRVIDAGTTGVYAQVFDDKPAGMRSVRWAGQDRHRWDLVQAKRRSGIERQRREQASHCIAYGFRNTDDLIALCLLCQGRELPSRDLRRAAAVTLDGVALGDIGVSDIAGTSGAQNWNVRGADFSKTFVLNASIEVAGAGFVGNEALRFQATVGCAP